MYGSQNFSWDFSAQMATYSYFAVQIVLQIFWNTTKPREILNLSVTSLVLQLSLPNPSKPGVKSRMKM